MLPFVSQAILQGTRTAGEDELHQKSIKLCVSFNAPGTAFLPRDQDPAQKFFLKFLLDEFHVLTS